MAVWWPVAFRSSRIMGLHRLASGRRRGGIAASMWQRIARRNDRSRLREVGEVWSMWQWQERDRRSGSRRRDFRKPALSERTLTVP